MLASLRNDVWGPHLNYPNVLVEDDYQSNHYLTNFSFLPYHVQHFDRIFNVLHQLTQQQMQTHFEIVPKLCCMDNFPIQRCLYNNVSAWSIFGILDVSYYLFPVNCAVININHIIVNAKLVAYHLWVEHHLVVAWCVSLHATLNDTTNHYRHAK